MGPITDSRNTTQQYTPSNKHSPKKNAGNAYQITSKGYLIRYLHQKRGMQLRYYILLLIILFFLPIEFLPCQILLLLNTFILAGNYFHKLAQNISLIRCQWWGVLQHIGRSHDKIFVVLIRVCLSFDISCSNEEIGYPHLFL